MTKLDHALQLNNNQLNRIIVWPWQTGDKLLATQEPEMPAYNTRVQINHDPGMTPRLGPARVSIVPCL
jgi:hypothetical protein